LKLVLLKFWVLSFEFRVSWPSAFELGPSNLELSRFSRTSRETRANNKTSFTIQIFRV